MRDDEKVIYFICWRSNDAIGSGSAVFPPVKTQADFDALHYELAKHVPGGAVITSIARL